MMALDEFVLWVNADKPYKTAKDYIDAIKKAPDNTFKMGGTGSKQEDQIITVALEKATGKKLTYIPDKGGGAVAVQLVGNHVDFSTNLLAEISLGVSPEKVGGPWLAFPQPNCFGCLLERQGGEVAELHEFRRLLVGQGQPGQGLVQGQELFGFFVCGDLEVFDLDPRASPAALLSCSLRRASSTATPAWPPRRQRNGRCRGFP